MTRAALASTDRNATVGDVAFWCSAGDRGGWYRLDGRALTALPARARANALTIPGMGANLPNAANRIPVPDMAAVGALGGSMTVTVAKANLPAITYTGNTPAGGAHTHNFNRPNWRKNGDAPPRDTQKDFAAGSTAEPTVNAADNVHSHTLTAPSGGSGTALATADKTVAAFLFVFLGG